MLWSRKAVLSALVPALVMAMAPAVAQAQEYPTRLIKIIVPFPPGGNPDLAARLVANRMSIDFGQSVIIENKPGANGSIGATAVAKSAPDGYTLLVANLGVLGINPVVREHLSYNIARDFVPVSRMAVSPLLLIVNAGLKIDSVKELIAAAKKEPNKLTFATAGVGSAAHMAAALFDQMADVKMMHIPYKGASEAAPATAAGNVSVTFGGQGAAWPLVANGNVKALGLTGTKRSPMHPDTPTIAEAGVPGYDIADWVGMLAPAGTPQPIIDKLNAEVQKALDDAETKKRFAVQGLEPVGGTPKEFTDYINAQQKKWAEVAQRDNIRVKD
jgi:tripartite-type tricarboxylate transporter receptor subunit TctC